MNKVIERARFDKLGHDGQIWWDTRNAYQKDNFGMTVLGQHIDLVAELLEKFFVDFGVEDFLHCHFKAFVLATMNCTEPAHGDLFKDFQIFEVYLQNRVQIEAE